MTPGGQQTSVVNFIFAWSANHCGAAKWLAGVELVLACRALNALRGICANGVLVNRAWTAAVAVHKLSRGEGGTAGLTRQVLKLPWSTCNTCSDDSTTGRILASWTLMAVFTTMPCLALTRICWHCVELIDADLLCVLQAASTADPPWNFSEASWLSVRSAVEARV